MPPPEIQHDPDAHRFSLTREGLSAVADYRLDGNRMHLTHTFVPPE